MNTIGLSVASVTLIGVVFLPRSVASKRAIFICYTIGSALALILSVIRHDHFGVGLHTFCMVIGALAAYNHWDDDDDDWPGPRKLTEWGKRKLAAARRPRPVPVPVKR